MAPRRRGAGLRASAGNPGWSRAASGHIPSHAIRPPGARRGLGGTRHGHRRRTRPRRRRARPAMPTPPGNADARGQRRVRLPHEPRPTATPPRARARAHSSGGGGSTVSGRPLLRLTVASSGMTTYSSATNGHRGAARFHAMPELRADRAAFSTRITWAGFVALVCCLVLAGCGASASPPGSSTKSGAAT